MDNNKKSFLPKKEIYLRLNYLYQAAHVILAINPDNQELARFYGKTLKAVAQKAVVRLDPTIKRNLCKKCGSLLLSGVTCKFRLRNRRERHVVITCLFCKENKRFLSKKDYSLRSEIPAASSYIPISYEKKTRAGTKDL